ncbi:hypothetical protein [Sphingomonas sp.]|uniref:hypothetical protein n=1 Tax=Sphingomonas sp. TaxID=28214 RepID=UPI0035B0F28B
MTDILAKVRAVALLLPEVEEGADNGEIAFLVDGAAFARFDGDTVAVRSDDGWHRLENGDTTLIEDRVARGWELTAPARLLEAGGR